MHSEPTWFDYWESAAGQTDRAWHTEIFSRFASEPVACTVQLGSPEVAAIDCVKSALRISALDRVPANSPLTYPTSTLLCEARAVPLQSESVDLVLWPHGFERSEDPDATLSEIHRILCPEGRLIVTFFNRFGFWSIKRHLPFAVSPLPQSVIALTTSEAKTRLLAAGLTCQSGAFGVYATHRDEARKSLLDLAGDRWWPTLANLVVLCARKKTLGTHLIGKAQFSEPQFSPLQIVPSGSANKEAL